MLFATFATPHVKMISCKLLLAHLLGFIPMKSTTFHSKGCWAIFAGLDLEKLWNKLANVYVFFGGICLNGRSV